MMRIQFQWAVIALLVAVCISAVLIVSVSLSRRPASDVDVVAEILGVPAGEDISDPTYLETLFTFDENTRARALYGIRLRAHLLSTDSARRIVAWLESEYYDERDSTQVRMLFRRAPDVMETALVERLGELQDYEMLFDRTRYFLPAIDNRYADIIDDSIMVDRQLSKVLALYEARQRDDED